MKVRVRFFFAVAAGVAAGAGSRPRAAGLGFRVVGRAPWAAGLGPRTHRGFRRSGCVCETPNSKSNGWVLNLEP